MEKAGRYCRDFPFQEKGSCSMVENVCCKVKITLVLMNCVQNCNNYLL